MDEKSDPAHNCYSVAAQGGSMQVVGTLPFIQIYNKKMENNVLAPPFSEETKLAPLLFQVFGSAPVIIWYLLSITLCPYVNHLYVILCYMYIKEPLILIEMIFIYIMYLD